MSKITYAIPTQEIYEVIEHYRSKFEEKGIAENERVAYILESHYYNADVMKKHGIDYWLSFGGCLPAVERVISKQNGESEEDFYRRTQYPKHVVEAYSLENDFNTLVFTAQYKDYHSGVMANTAVWDLNDEGGYIDLNEYENRLKEEI